MKLSFKREARETGLRSRSISKPYPDVQIKGDKAQVGKIYVPSAFGDTKWKVSVAVCNEPTQENPCPFKWVRFTFTGESEDDVRDWVKSRWNAIVKQYDLYRFVD